MPPKVTNCGQTDCTHNDGAGDCALEVVTLDETSQCEEYSDGN